MQNHLQNYPKGQICPVLTVGWPMLSGFVVEGRKKYELMIHTETHSVCAFLKLFQISQGLRVETKFVKATWKLRCIKKSLFFFLQCFTR